MAAAASSASSCSVSKINTNEIRFDAFQKCFMRGTAHIKGLLPVLKECFYPKYDYTRATLNRITIQQTDDQATEYQKRQATKKMTKADKRTKGILVGQDLDKQITATVEVLIRFPDLPIRIFYDEMAAAVSSMPPWAKDCLKSNNMPQTKAFWQAIEKLKLKPVRTQVVVAAECASGPIAHAIDVVCINSKGDYTLLEIKSGFTGYLKNCTGFMQKPLQQLTDCPENQHQLQLCASKEMYENTFPDHNLTTSILLQIEGDKVTMTKEAKWTASVKSWMKIINFNKTSMKQTK